MSRVLYGLLIGLGTIGSLLLGEWYVILFLSIVFFFCQWELATLLRRQLQTASSWRSFLWGTLGTILFAVLVWLVFTKNATHSQAQLLTEICLIASGLYLTLRILGLYWPVRTDGLSELLDLMIYVPLACFLAYWMTMRHGYFNSQVLLGVFFLIWSSDVGAYYVGRKLGRTKLFPSHSPNKTWEGALGGLTTALLVSSALMYFFHEIPAGHWIGLAFLVWLFALFGDLLESKIKRSASVKDSGNLLGGHGGFLDRFDAFLGAVPFAALYLWLFKL